MAMTGGDEPREARRWNASLPEGFRRGPSIYWQVGPEPAPLSDAAPTDPASTDTASTDTAPTDTASTETASTDTAPSETAPTDSRPDWVREREDRDAAARVAVEELAWLQQQHDLLEARAIGLRSTLASLAMAGEPNLQHQQLELRSMAREVGARLTVGHGTARHWLEQASEMTALFPAVHAALAAGTISARQATVIVASAGILTDSDVTPAQRAEYCEAAIERAAGRVPGKLAEIATRLAERFVSRPITVRHRAAVADRHVELCDLADGMAAITGVLPGVQAHAIFDRLATGSSRKCKDDPRTADQWRADAFARLLISGRVSEHGAPGGHGAVGHGTVGHEADGHEAGGHGADGHSIGVYGHGGHDLGDEGHDAAGRCLDPHGDESCGDPVVGITHCDEPSCTPATINGITPSIAITVPALSLAADDDWFGVEPAMLTGRRPMSMTTAACMIEACKQELQRWITHPISGQVMAVDARFGSAQLSREVTARDGGRCRQSSCSSHRGVQHDHIDRWVDGGRTSLDNLAGLCRSCHIVKDNTRWGYRLSRDGDVEWTTPLGYRYRDRPIPAADTAAWPNLYDPDQWDADQWDADQWDADQWDADQAAEHSGERPDEQDAA